MNKVTITQVDCAWCKVDRPTRLLFEECLEYESVWYNRGRYGRKEKKTAPAYLMDRRNNEFLVGLLPRVVNHLKEKGYVVRLVKEPLAEEFDNVPILPRPHIPWIKFRPYQLKFIKNAMKKKRGVIVAPTGSGKTTVFLGLISMFPYAVKKLILCHSTDILKQTFDSVPSTNKQLIGGKGDKRFKMGHEVFVSTINKYHNELKKDFSLGEEFGVVIVDEAHHCISTKGMYGKALAVTWAPYVFGLTATEPDTEIKRLSLEALIGPTIQNMSVQEGIDYKVLSKPEIELISVPFESELGSLYKYRDVYKEAIVFNKTRNKIIAELAKQRTDQNKTSLIMVKEIEQGEQINELCRELGVRSHFIHGDTGSKTRDVVKKRLDSGKIPVIIASVIWKEGVDIPSLNTVINACGGKSEITTLQAIGRGLRRTEKKNTVLIIDFLDPYRYLAQHTVMRLQTYQKAGWLKKVDK